MGVVYDWCWLVQIPKTDIRVGEVWIGVADPNGWADAIRAHPHGYHRWVLLPGETEPQSVIEGDRQLIRTVAASFALETLYKLLIELQKNS